MQTIKEEKMSEYSYSRRFLLSVVKSQGRSRVIRWWFFGLHESPFSAFFCVCEVPRPPTGCRYLSLIVLGANKKSRCRCLHFIPHIHTPKKMASFTATVRICVRFLQYTREMYLARFAFVYARARADVFFFLSVAGKFATHVGINPFNASGKNQSRFS